MNLKMEGSTKPNHWVEKDAVKESIHRRASHP